MDAWMKSYPVEIGRRPILFLYLLTVLASCETALKPIPSFGVAEIFAIPDAGHPSIMIFPDSGGTTGHTLIMSLTGEAVTHQWAPVDSSESLLFGQIANSCASQAMERVNVVRLNQEEVPSEHTQDDIVSGFTPCMESQGLTGEQTDLVLPSSFLFGVRNPHVDVRYAAEKKGVTLAQFKRDVRTSATPFLDRDRPALVRYPYDRSSPVSGGQLGPAVGSTNHPTIAPGGVTLKEWMEKLG